MSKDITNIKKKIAPILKSHDVKKAAIFGSFARGEQNKKSDIDILIKFKKDNDKSLFDLVGLRLDLEEVLKRKVDVLTYNSLHPLLKNIILKEQKAIL
ncbi:MAG: nucleotidyltransferase family protein [bacterium]|nr:nucleotidyltransferase family protein [bacterium]